MKNLHSKLSGIAPFVFFPLFVTYRKRKKTFYAIICIMLISLSSCYLNFYRTNTTSSIDANTASKLSSENKYFVVHFTNSTNGLEGIYLKGDSIYGKIVPLPIEHSKNLYPSTASEKNRVKHIDKPYTLMEVHLYTTLSKLNDDSLFTASLSSFNRADVYELNKQATNTNHILSTVGIVLTVFTIIGTIALAAAANSAATSAASGCNCPQVYMENNGAYNFISGTYSGALYSTLERTDYLPLETVPYHAKNISFKIATPKNEEQFINKVSLLQVNHLPGTYVLPDRHGNIFSYSSIQLPVNVEANGNAKELLEKTDCIYYSFDDSANNNGLSDVKLSFDKPSGTNKVKLIIHARNSYWGALLHKEFVNYFGEGFEKWRQKQEQANPKDLEKWQTDQALPLMVYVKTAEGWKFVDYFPAIGNTASRDMIMQLNTENIPGNKIELKLETAYRFWDLDFAGIDFSNDNDFTTTALEAQQILKSDNTDQKEALLKSDKAYSILSGNESISFKYPVPSAKENMVSSYVLVSGGYYHNLEKITGKINYTELYKFQQPGAFDKFSRAKYKEVQDVAAVLNGNKR